MTTLISIGTLAKRSGVKASALRFYESKGLISSVRSNGQTRQFPREVLRRVAFIRVAQNVGLSLEDIATALASLPQQRTPTLEDWAQLSESWRPMLQAKIDALSALQTQLDSCIGCGCLSLQKCKLYNHDDQARHLGTGPRFLMGDHAADLALKE
ncbi:redox-sensitive transcriptional activator SoxR [Iodobacter fluviatilis]|uniref:Redox-sensitive transcriptional activator soxR n=1 Tax=Iodobacter fluviatilis TaxID=537 RepID=A0A377Q2M5_9NEIS|nr:redox-sensitive transcriptional activator SoxR [Iodobacter fluviatilis]TCU89991.1 MerR family redox-sensitive transcriptional activator SoxR [Iodobacter fluviatilis]STQ89018.1 Redox-sensitive transcriptional activator soxR [Iodobacter fluviatilis]